MVFRALIDPAATGGVGVAFTDREGALPSASPSDLVRESSGWLRLDSPTGVGVARWQGLGFGEVVGVDQVHGDTVVVVDERLMSGRVTELPRADALVSRLPGIGLVIRTADCLPVALADPHAGVVGVAHAGRRGLDVGVLPRTVSVMRTLGARRLRAWIGPGICAQCYEVDAPLADAFVARHPLARATTRWGTPALDLLGVALGQLADAGVEVEVLPGCTREDADLFSHRRDGAAAGRQAAIAWLVAPGGGSAEPAES